MERADPLVQRELLGLKDLLVQQDQQELLVELEPVARPDQPDQQVLKGVLAHQVQREVQG